MITALTFHGWCSFLTINTSGYADIRKDAKSDDDSETRGIGKFLLI